MTQSIKLKLIMIIENSYLFLLKLTQLKHYLNKNNIVQISCLKKQRVQIIIMTISHFFIRPASLLLLTKDTDDMKLLSYF